MGPEKQLMAEKPLALEHDERESGAALEGSMFPWLV